MAVLAVIPSVSVATCLPLRSHYSLCRLPCFEQSVQRLGYWLDGPGFESRQRQEIFVLQNVHTGVGPILFPIQWVLGSFLGLKRPGREIGRLPPVSA